MLIDIIQNNYKIISIVGMGKNAGKTVTLNHLIEEAAINGITIGITSTGRDGEGIDLVTGTEKPSIYAFEGTYIATSEKALKLGDAKIEIIKVTDYRTPMGKIVIGKVRDAGYVQIAGPQTTKEIKAISNILIDFGAEVVFIDGAINRLSSAAPSVSQGCILATGAVVSRDMNKVIRDTLHAVELFKLPEVKEDTLRVLIKDIIQKENISLIDENYNVKTLDIKTSLNSGKIISQHITKSTRYVIFPGSLVKNTIEDIVKGSRLIKNVTFVVRDGTKIFVGPVDWLRLCRQGLKVKALNSVSTLAVTINPYSPQGYYFDQREFLNSMKKHLKDIPVFDVVHGGEYKDEIYR
ncbi:MAG: hypothetical protein FH761_13650 [Firmicutes bacterium]|nr:hypothetical protein [Bacillota bacterium]